MPKNFQGNEYKHQKEEVRRQKREKRLRRRQKTQVMTGEMPPSPIALPPASTGPERGRSSGLVCKKFWTKHDWSVWPLKCVRCGHERTVYEANMEGQYRANYPQPTNLNPGVLPRQRTSLEDDPWEDDDMGMGYRYTMGGSPWYAGMGYGFVGYDWDDIYGSVKADDIKKIAIEVCGSLYWCVGISTVAA